jgi:prophage regulatory protein
MLLAEGRVGVQIETMSLVSPPARTRVTEPPSKGEPAMAHRLIRLPEACRITGLSRSAIYRQIAAGAFVSRVRLGTRAIGFHEAELLDWISRRERIQQERSTSFHRE